MSAAPLVAVAVAGRIASGKSTIARRVAERLGATLIVADRIREGAVAELAEQSTPEEARLRGLERPVDDAVYAELLRRAGDELAARRSVVLDAAFARRAQRDAAVALAARHRAGFRLIECRADATVVQQRLAGRAAEAGIPVARWLVLRDALDAYFEPLDELVAEECLRLDTSGEAARAAAAALAWLAASRGG